MPVENLVLTIGGRGRPDPTGPMCLHWDSEDKFYRLVFQNEFSNCFLKFRDFKAVMSFSETLLGLMELNARGMERQNANKDQIKKDGEAADGTQDSGEPSSGRNGLDGEPSN